MKAIDLLKEIIKKDHILKCPSEYGLRNKNCSNSCAGTACWMEAIKSLKD